GGAGAVGEGGASRPPGSRRARNPPRSVNVSRAISPPTPHVNTRVARRPSTRPRQWPPVHGFVDARFHADLHGLLTATRVEDTYAAFLEGRDDAASCKRSRPVAASRRGGGAGLGGDGSGGRGKHRPGGAGGAPGPGEAPDCHLEP